MIRINLQRQIIVTVTRTDGSMYDVKCSAVAGRFTGIFPEKQDPLEIELIRAYAFDTGMGRVYDYNVGEYTGPSEVDDYKLFAAEYNKPEHWAGRPLMIPAKNIDSIEVIDD